MTTLIVPEVDLAIPTLGDQVADFIEERCVFGPGSLQDQPARLDPEKLGIIYRCYEVYPMGHRLAGTRIFDRCAIEIRKGLAKCPATLTTMISMADGSRKRADKIQVGDEVLAYNVSDEFAPRGGLVVSRVTAVEPQAASPMVRVTTERGRVLEVTTDHPVLTRGTLWRTGMPKRRRYASCDPDRDLERWTNAADLAPGDRVVVGLGWSGSGGLDPDDAWILGAWVGDGSGTGQYSAGDTKLELVDRINLRFPMTKCSKRECDWYARGIRPFLREHGLYGKGSYTKQVPAAVMTAKPDAVLAFLAGYLDTDGWVSYTPKANGKTHIEIAIGSVNRPLLEDCQHLLASLGFNASLVKSMTTYKGEPHLSWNLAVRDQTQAKELAEQLIPHMVNTHKLGKLSEIIGHTGRRPFAHRDTDKIVAVERIPDGETMGIEVADFHTYVTNGIVTHNTELAAWIAFAELHPESPVRFDGFEPDGTLRQGKPVMAPYIPMMASAEEQVQELAFGVLKYIVEHSADADLFDCSLERIVRLGRNGSNDGMVVPVSNAPATRDGARTTFEHFDEPLALDTLVPTPFGWSTIGGLTAGDYVYGRDGKPVLVLGVSPIHVGRKCYRVTFTDGSEVITDASHRWKAVEWSNIPAGEQVVTTQHMVDRGVDTHYGKRWRLPRSSGYDGVERDLPIDPYLAGMWLGDGATNAGYIHSSHDDYKTVVGDYTHTVSRDVRQDVVRWLPTGLRAKLRACGMLGNKHIIDDYRFASRRQRMELLAGLIDSDGYVIPGTGSVTFVQGAERLARDVYELTLSLGFDSSLTKRPDVRSRTGVMWKVQFFANKKIPTRLERKATQGVSKQRPSWPTIASITPTESVPVRCITVDNDDRLFVFGRESRLTHNSHRLILPNAKAAHETMIQNLPKRQLEHPWALYTSTAGQPGQQSVEEDVRAEAEAIAEGKAPNSSLFFFSRWAGPEFDDLSTVEARVAAIDEATGPCGEWGLGQFERIAKDYDRKGIDKSYWERVYLNRWRKSGSQAFDMKKVNLLVRRETGGPAQDLGKPHQILKGAFCTLGFDGARFRDSTAFVLTEIETGLQQILGLWERPTNIPDDARWEVDHADVDGVLAEAFSTYEIWRAYCDPPYWVETVADWVARYPEQIIEWWTNRPRAMAYSLRNYTEAIDSESIAFGGNDVDDLVRHIGHAGRKELKIRDDEDVPLWVLQKQDGQLANKFDACMASVLSWEARTDAIREGAKPKQKVGAPRRLY